MNVHCYQGNNQKSLPYRNIIMSEIQANLTSTNKYDLLSMKKEQRHKETIQALATQTCVTRTIFLSMAQKEPADCSRTRFDM